jgi:hypothetical protein
LLSLHQRGIVLPAIRAVTDVVVTLGHYCLTAALTLAERYAQAIDAPVELRPRSSCSLLTC